MDADAAALTEATRAARHGAAKIGGIQTKP
jgi:hypothetical protein